MKIKTETKAILTIPAWAEALHSGEMGQRDTIKDAAAAYAYVPLIFRATRLVCNSLVSVPVHFFEGETEVEFPFPDISLRSLLWKSQAAMSLNGANFVEKVSRRRSGNVGSLQWVNPTTMETPKLIKNDRTGKIDYEFKQKKNPNVTWNLDTMIYMREFSLNDDVGPGDSSAKVSLNDAALLRYMSRFAARFFETGAMPITVLQIEGIVDPDEATRIEGFFKKAATRIRNAFNVLALSRQIEPKIISQPLKDLVMPELADQARRAVADAFDMHPSLLEEAPNMATAQEHRLSLYQDSVEPRAMLLAEEFNRQLFKPMGIEMRFGFDELDIYQEDENERSASVEALTRAISADPETAEFVMMLLGYDLDEKQTAMFRQLINQKKEEKEKAQELAARPAPQARPGPTQRPAARAAWLDDLDRWERKALRIFKENKSAVCEYTSDLIPSNVRAGIEAALANCKSADEIKAAFDNQKPTEPAEEKKAAPEALALAESINKLAAEFSAKPKDEPAPVVILNNSRPRTGRPPLAKVFVNHAFEQKGVMTHDAAHTDQ